MNLKLNLRLMAVVVILASLSLFIATGNFATQPDANAQTQVTSENQAQDPVNHKKNTKPEAVKSVRAQRLEAKEIEQTLTLRGKTGASAILNLRAETEGRIAIRHVESGAVVKEGDQLFSLDPRDLHAKIEHGKALVAQKKLAYERAERLKKENLLSSSDLAETFVELKSAESILASLQVSLKALEIRAPFDGVMDLRYVEEGQWVIPGESLAKFASYDPLLIKLDASAKEAHQIKSSQIADIELATGETFQANVFFISLMAKEATNTFEIVLNATEKFDPLIGEGIAATVTIPIGKVTAQSVSPALFELDSQGDLTLKHVNDEGIVQRSSIEIIKAESKEVWVTGLPTNALLITQGHGFVKAGDKVAVEL